MNTERNASKREAKICFGIAATGLTLLATLVLLKGALAAYLTPNEWGGLVCASALMETAVCRGILCWHQAVAPASTQGPRA